MAGLLNSIGSIIDPSTYMSASQNANRTSEDSRNMAFDRRLGQQRFDIEKMLAMQDFRAEEKKQKWQRDFAYALGGLNG